MTKGGAAYEEKRADRAVTETDVLWARTSAHKCKVARALSAVENVLKMYEPGAVSFSGGKDSTALLNLIHTVDPAVPSVWFDSGEELQSTRDIVAHYGSDIVLPKRSIVEMCRIGGYWGYSGPETTDVNFRFSDILIHEPSKRYRAETGRNLQIIGLRAEESAAREWSARTHGELHKMAEGWTRFCPLIRWSVDDVWGYIASTGCVYNTAYDRMTAMGISRADQRIGTLLGGSATSMGRYVYLKRCEPDTWNRLASEFPELRKYA